MRINLPAITTKTLAINAGASALTGVVFGYISARRDATVSEDIAEDPQMSLFENWQSAIAYEKALIEYNPELRAIRDELEGKSEVVDRIFYEGEEVSEMDVLMAEELEEDAEDNLAEDEEMEAALKEPVLSNVFDKEWQYPDWDYEAEVAQRTREAPYVIHEDEFVQNEKGYIQGAVTFFEADGVMANDDDVPIHDYVKIMGELKFGHGSGDPTVVFIRNDELGLEWEVQKDPNSYETIVLGHDIENQYEQSELKHSNSLGRFRDE